MKAKKSTSRWSSTWRGNPAPELSTRRTARWVVAAGLGIAIAAILVVMNPPLLLSANTPSGGDMGAHVAVPAYLRDVLLPEGRILGWSNDWFAGFPFLYFYFPIPALFTVLLDLVLPYGVAFKLTTIVGLLALPPATYFLVRTMRFSRSVAVVGAAAGAAFVFMESYSIYGANIPSTLAGEFSFSWSFALVMVYLGLLIQSVRDGRPRVALAGLVLGLTALTHLVTTLLAIIASLPVMRWKLGGRRVAASWAIGFAVSAFWSIPLLARVAYSADMAWVPLSGWKNVLPSELWLLLVPAAVGMAIAVRRSTRSTPLVVLTVVPVIYYFLIQRLPHWLPDDLHQIQAKLWNGRFLPFFYYGVWVFAGIALGVALLAAVKRLPTTMSVWWVRALIVIATAGSFLVSDQVTLGSTAGWAAMAVGAVLLAATFGLPRRLSTLSSAPLFGAVVVLVGALAGMSFIPGWVRWNYTGYEGKAAAGEYFGLMETIDALPPGRVQWEYNKDQNKYGTPMALMLIPYWTEDADPSMEGLFFESSLTTPFHFLNQAEMSYAPSRPVPGLNYHTFDFARGLEHLELYGVRYYVTYTEEARQKADTTPELTRVAESPPFTVYELPPTSLVEAARFVPSVYDGSEDFGDAALGWYDRRGFLDRWLVADGPAEWPRVADVADIPTVPESAEGAVTDVVVENDRISFRTTAVGVPHLVKVSYFPNWQADGADGPYRAAPSLMVVVPTQEEVTLEFRSRLAEKAGVALTLIGLVVVAGVTIRNRREAA